jgi:hypothetical protein
MHRINMYFLISRAFEDYGVDGYQIVLAVMSVRDDDW